MLGIEHFIFCAARPTSFLASDFFALLLRFTFDAENFSFEFIAQVAAGNRSQTAQVGLIPAGQALGRLHDEIAADQIAGIAQFTGRDKPDVIT